MNLKENSLNELKAFRIFNEAGGKFRLAITERCNLDCFFCHNEGQKKPGVVEGENLGLLELVEVANAFTDLGGKQLNITGGEPLLWKNIHPFLDSIEKRNTKIFLNTNATQVDKFLEKPKSEVVDGILASLHTTDNKIFQEELKGKTIQGVMKNILRLKEKAYSVFINCSIGEYNQTEFLSILSFCLKYELHLKVISIIRHNTAKNFYKGVWMGPEHLKTILLNEGAVLFVEKDSFGGKKALYKLNNSDIEIKDVSKGSLRTDYCRACSYDKLCGEGIYGLRFGNDGIWKPCLLRKEEYQRRDLNLSYREQILQQIQRMIGVWQNAYFSMGEPL